MSIKYKSIVEKYIKLGELERFIIRDEGSIKYKATGKSYNLTNPEESIRTSFAMELIIKYKYPAERIDTEVKTKPDKDAADIVVYEDDELKQPYLVIECKKDGISDAEYKSAIDQVFRYANYLRAKYAAVIAGNTRTIFNVSGFKTSEREKNVISDIPVKYGKEPRYKFIKGHSQKDIKAVPKEDLIRTLKKAHDTVWQGGRLAPTTAFDEVSKLLFCKLRDEKEGTRRGKYYKFQIGTHESSEEIYSRVNSIYKKAQKQDPDVFKDGIRLDPKIVYAVVEHLQGISFGKTDLDTKGVAFEIFMTDFFKGKMGQFFTPREIIDFCVKMIRPTRGNLVLDPACGSGGFLLNALDRVRKSVERNYEEKEAWQHWHKFAMNNLYGIEINDQIARICKMNMIIHDDGHTNIISSDSLKNFNEINKIHKGFKKDHFDIILTNPPFGAKIKSTEHNYLDQYELGAKNKKRNSQKTEILFIERCLEFLKPGTGKMAIVLPDGILTNSSLQYVRDFLMKQAQILAIVSLPQFVFSHYGAGVKSSLVFVRKKGHGEKLGRYKIFMAIAEHIGYDATGRKDTRNDLDKIYKEYKKFKKNN